MGQAISPVEGALYEPDRTWEQQHSRPSSTQAPGHDLWRRLLWHGGSAHLSKKGWSIVAAANRAGPKIGQDQGRLAGLNEDLGVIVQDCETADYAAMGADIALVVQTERLNRT